MSSQAKKVKLAGSHRPPMPKSQLIGPVHPDERVEVTVRLRPRAPLSAAVQAATLAAGSPKKTQVHDARATG